MTHLISVADFLMKGHIVVPSYQRGYKWSLLRTDSGDTHLERLLNDLAAAAEKPEEEYHLQGVTVKQEAGEIELVDGQQRITSVYLLLLYAHAHGVSGLDMLLMREDRLPRLDYRVRDELKDWLRAKLTGEHMIDPARDNRKVSDIQDIAAFHRAWEQLAQAMEKVLSLDSFVAFVLKRVKLICVRLHEGLSPTKVFSMMNNEKAVMSKSDLVKAKLLSDASRADGIGTEASDEGEWQINQRRSQYAREWDRWRQWWENEKHHRFFERFLGTPQNEPKMAWLLRFYLSQVGSKPDALYSELELRIQANAPGVFEEIRTTQEILEEWYDDAEIYNALGLLFYGGTSGAVRERTLLGLFKRYLRTKIDFANKAMEEAQWSLIPREGDESPREAAHNVLNGLLQENVYDGPFKEHVFRQLLRMNVALLPKNERFPFEQYHVAERSLEHIQPKSKVIRKLSQGWQSDDDYAQELAFTQEQVKERIDAGYIDLRDADSGISEHCIGNLVLLNKGDNSAVGTKDLRRKREILFDRLRRGNLLLHTLKVLSKTFVRDENIPSVEVQANKLFDDDQWTVEDIIGYRRDFEQNFREYYGLEQSKELL